MQDILNDFVITTQTVEMFPINSSNTDTRLNINALVSLGREFLSFVMRLDSTSVITQSSTLKLQVRTMPVNI